MRYTQIEKEALALTWACERCNDDILGMDTVHLETDHKPLVPLLSKKDWTERPPRIQRFKMILMRYRYTISHVPGESIITADLPSRKPIPRDETDRVLEKETKAYFNMIIEHIPATEERLEEIKEAQAEDEICKELIRYCELGWPDKQSVPDVLKQYGCEI